MKRLTKNRSFYSTSCGMWVVTSGMQPSIELCVSLSLANHLEK